MTEVRGTVAPGFEPVLDAVAAVAGRLAAQPGAGLAVAVHRHGRQVVDVWAGAVAATSLVHTWSAVKPVVGTALLLVAGRAGIPLDSPVRRLWPRLRAAAEGPLTLRQVLGHGAGLASVPPPGTARSLLDWAAAVDRIESAVPDWRPGDAVGEHALTYGHLVGELVRRIDGRPLDLVVAEELAGPFELDLRLGVPHADRHRVVDTVGLSPEFWNAHRGPPGTPRFAALAAGVDGALVNSVRWRAAQLPAVNGYAAARALSLFYARVLDGALPDGALRPAAAGIDRVLGRPVVWTLAGGQRTGTEIAMGGVGGQYAGAFADLDLTVAYLSNAMDTVRGATEIKAAARDCAIAAGGGGHSRPPS